LCLTAERGSKDDSERQAISATGGTRVEPNTLFPKKKVRGSVLR